VGPKADGCGKEIINKRRCRWPGGTSQTKVLSVRKTSKACSVMHVRRHKYEARVGAQENPLFDTKVVHRRKRAVEQKIVA